MVFSVMSLLASLAQPLELLKYYSIRCFYDHLLNFRKETRQGKSKSKYRKQIDESEPFERMMVRLKAWTADPDFIGHPKLEQVRAEVLQHFIDAGEGANGGQRTATRVEIFSHYRDSVEEICRLLQKDSPIVRPHVFVGQSAGKNSEGMSQKKQLEVTAKFKNGDYNVLISTSVGEEGLDIGEVDLIICYDSKSSPIRLLQRMGRTGRKRAGRVVWLQMKGKEQDDAIKAMDGYEKMQELIANGDHFTFHHDRSRRMVPKDIQPIVDKRAVEIPVENTQRTPSDFLPVPTKRGRGRAKLPPKKFHMPDGVRRGFVTASRFDDDDEEDDRVDIRWRKQEPPDESELVPSLNDVLLSETQTRELERRYQSATGADEDTFISKPRTDLHPQRQRHLGRTKYVPHGRASKSLVDALNRMISIDEYSVQEHEATFQRNYLEPEDIGHTLVDSQLHYDIDEGLQKQGQRPPRRGRLSKATVAKTKPRAARGRKAKHTAPTSSAMEADASSPPPSSPRMAIRSQAITLGSADTPPHSNAEEGDGYIDSDLADFVVDDAEPLTVVSSSLPSLSATYKRPQKEVPESQLGLIDSSQDLPDVATLFTSTARKKIKGKNHTPVSQDTEEQPLAVRPNARKRRKVVSDDDGDE
jgi:ATP-dependent DNA helicase MPH1